MLPMAKTEKIKKLYMSRTTPKIMKLRKVKIMLSTWPVRKFCTRLWSPILCSRSPISLVSKNAIGSLRSFIKKSLTREMLIRIDICKSSQRRMKSVAVLPITIMSSPRRISQIKPMSLCRMPKSTIACVRNGIIS